MKFLDLITVDRIISALTSTNKEEVIKELLETFKLTKPAFKKMFDLVMERESRGTTGMGEGIALPHSNQTASKEITGAFGRSAPGVDFNALDGQPVHLVFLVISGDAHKGLHIEGLKYISKVMRNAIYKRFLLEAKGKREIAKILKEIDEKEQLG